MDHQAATVLYFGTPSVNYIPVMDPKGKHKLAYIAHGKETLQDFKIFIVPFHSLPAVNHRILMLKL